MGGVFVDRVDIMSNINFSIFIEGLLFADPKYTQLGGEVILSIEMSMGRITVTVLH